MVHLIPFLSTLLQLIAALLALRLTRLARGSWGWLLLALAMLLMALRRGMAGMENLANPRPMPASELVSLLISIFMVAGMVGVGHLLRAGRRAELALLEAEGKSKAEGERMTLLDAAAREAQAREGANQKAAELGRFLELVIDAASMWISTLDAEGRVVIWNRGAEEISGYAREEVQGRSDFWAWLYPDPEIRARMASEVASLLRGGNQTKGEETTLHRKDGTLRKVTWYVCPIYGRDGQTGGTLAVGHDVTELRGTQEDLQRTRTIQNLILDNSAMGIALVRNRSFQWMNARGAEILGLSLQEAQGSPTRNVYPDDASYEAFAKAAYPVMAKGGYWDTRWRLRKPSGNLFWCRLVGKALDPEHVEEGGVWLIEDITTKMAVESALAESEERFRGAFEGTQDALILLTPKGIFDCNHQALRLFGLEDKSEILQRSLKDFCPSRQPGGEGSEEGLGHHLQSALVGEFVHFQWHFRRQGMGEFPAEVYLNTFPVGKRKVLLACLRPVQIATGIVRDLEREADLPAFLDRSPLATLIVDAQRRQIVYCNREALRILKCRMEEILGMGPEDISPMFQPDGRLTRTFTQEMDAMALHGGSHRFRHIHRSPHREDFAVDVTLTALQPGYSPLLVVNWAEVSE